MTALVAIGTVESIYSAMILVMGTTIIAIIVGGVVKNQLNFRRSICESADYTFEKIKSEDINNKIHTDDKSIEDISTIISKAQSNFKSQDRDLFYTLHFIRIIGCAIPLFALFVLFFFFTAKNVLLKWFSE